MSAHKKSCEVYCKEDIAKQCMLAVSMVKAVTIEQKGPGHRAQPCWPEKSSRDTAVCGIEEKGGAMHNEESHCF